MYSKEILEQHLQRCEQLAQETGGDTYFNSAYFKYLEQLAAMGRDLQQEDLGGGGTVVESIFQGNFNCIDGKFDLKMFPYQSPEGANIRAHGFNSRGFANKVSAGFYPFWKNYFFNSCRDENSHSPQVWSYPIGGGHGSLFLVVQDQVLLVEKDKHKILGFDFPLGGGLGEEIPLGDYKYNLLVQKEMTEEGFWIIDDVCYVLGLSQDDHFTRECIGETYSHFQKMAEKNPAQRHPVLNFNVNEIRIWPVEVVPGPDTVTTYQVNGYEVAAGPEKGVFLVPQDPRVSNNVEVVYPARIRDENFDLRNIVYLDGETDPHKLERNMLTVSLDDFYQWLYLIEDGKEVGPVVKVNQLANGHKGTPAVRREFLFNRHYALFSAFMGHPQRANDLLSRF